jgi:hypothetical protein
VQRGFGLVYLDLAGREASRTGALLQPAPEERLARAVFAPYGFEAAAAGCDGGQLFIECR